MAAAPDGRAVDPDGAAEEAAVGPVADGALEEVPQVRSTIQSICIARIYFIKQNIQPELFEQR